MNCDICGAETTQIYCNKCAFERFLNAIRTKNCKHCGQKVYPIAHPTYKLVAKDGTCRCKEAP